MSKLERLKTELDSGLAGLVQQATIAYRELTLTVDSEDIIEVCTKLRDDFAFTLLIDISGIDYATYGETEWQTDTANSGFSRAVEKTDFQAPQGQRFALAYHLLSVNRNIRLRIKTHLDSEQPITQSVHQIWPAAEWHEREAFDMFGILFTHHPDLRRILTDYGFVGHPFRKDFPLSGHVEMRYDENEKRIVYGPVEIEPRTLVPRVIRDDSRYGGKAVETTGDAK